MRDTSLNLIAFSLDRIQVQTLSTAAPLSKKLGITKKLQRQQIIWPHWRKTSLKLSCYELASKQLATKYWKSCDDRRKQNHNKRSSFVAEQCKKNKNKRASPKGDSLHSERLMFNWACTDPVGLDWISVQSGLQKLALIPIDLKSIHSVLHCTLATEQWPLMGPLR